MRRCKNCKWWKVVAFTYVGETYGCSRGAKDCKSKSLYKRKWWKFWRAK